MLQCRARPRRSAPRPHQENATTLAHDYAKLQAKAKTYATHIYILFTIIFTIIFISSDSTWRYLTLFHIPTFPWYKFRIPPTQRKSSCRQARLRQAEAAVAHCAVLPPAVQAGERYRFWMVSLRTKKRDTKMTRSIVLTCFNFRPLPFPLAMLWALSAWIADFIWYHWYLNHPHWLSVPQLQALGATATESTDWRGAHHKMPEESLGSDWHTTYVCVCHMAIWIHMDPYGSYTSKGSNIFNIQIQ